MICEIDYFAFNNRFRLYTEIMITLRHLQFLVAVADELNFSRAAETCFVTQPTLSAGVKELEERLGVILAERSKRSVIMTPLGLKMVERAQAILRDVDELEALAAAHTNPAAGDLRLGSIPTIGPFLIPKALPAVRAAFPDLRLYLREELTESLLDGLRSGRLDVVLIALPFEIGDLQTMHLFNDGYHLVAPAGAGAFGKKEVGGCELEGAHLMLLEKGHCLQRHALKAFPDHDIEQDESFSATSLTTLISMVAEGLGITLLPHLAIDAGILTGQDGVETAPLHGDCPREIVLAWRPTSPRKELFVKLAEIFNDTRQKLRA